MATDCCIAAGKPLVQDYTPVGTFHDVGGTRMYAVGSGKSGVILITDIFGLEFTQGLQMADWLSEHGFSLLVPDMFNGQPWTMDKFPPKPEHNMREWFAHHDWQHTQPTVTKAAEYLRSAGILKLGVIGFCWGACMAISAAGEPSLQVSAVGCCHPAFFGHDKELAENCPCPVAIAAAKGDPMESIREVMETKPFADKCVYRRFMEQTHGFMAARGDYSQPEVAAAAAEGIAMMAQFFHVNLA